MIETVTIILVIILFARSSEELTKLPTTLFLILYACLFTSFFPDFFMISDSDFDTLLYLMIPVILLPDLLKLDIRDFQKNIMSILYLAIVSVILSIAIAVVIAPFLLYNYEISIVGFIALFTMLMATDAITVSSIFSNFHLPKQLKIYAEGESLLNDVTALVIFYFLALPMLNGVDISFYELNLVIVKVVAFSIIIGVVSGVGGFMGIKILKDPIEQFIIIYLVSIVSFLFAEHLHISGILSVITSILTLKILLYKELKKNPNMLISKFNHHSNNKDLDFYAFLHEISKYTPAMTRREFRGYKKEATYIGIFANGIVFIIMASLFDFDHLFQYSYEIIIVFFLSTLIRLVSISSFIKVGKKDFEWSIALTLSGVKGALSIIMVHSLSPDFIHKEMFEAVVVGNVILTTFIYTLYLVYFINKNCQKFRQDIIKEDLKLDNKNIDILKLRESLEKDQITNAYNRIFIEEILEKEIGRANRYKLELSIIAFKLQNLSIFSQENQSKILKIVSKKVYKKIRGNDYYGRMAENYYLILTTNTPLSGATILADRLEKKFSKISYEKHKLHSYFGITDINETDNLETLLEKLEDALTKAKYKNKIEIAY